MAHRHTNLLWWGPPKKFSDRVQERKVSWLELFYDLVYVAAIAQMTHHLAQHPSWSEAGFSFLIFSMVFWSWVNGSQYYDLHGSDNIRTRLLTFWQMLAVAGVAITIGDAYEGRHQAFAIAFSFLQIMVTYLWWSVSFYDPSHRVFSKYYTFNYLIALFLLVVSIFTDAPTATIIWIVVVLFNLSPPLTAARTVVTALKQQGEIFTASAALLERFGLFTIILLAESILGTVSGIAELEHKNAVVWVSFMLAILIAFLLWSIYFDMTSEQETKKGYNYLQWLVFLHFPLLASLSIIGACFNILLSHMESECPPTIPWMFCMAFSVFLFSIVGITRIMEEDEEDRSYIVPVVRLLVISGIILLAVPLLGPLLDTVRLLSVVAIILFIPVFVGVRSWVMYKYFSSAES